MKYSLGNSNFLEGTDAGSPVGVQESPAEAWLGGALLQGQGHWVRQSVHGSYWRRLPFSYWGMGIPDHLTCLLRNLYAGQEVTVRTGHETTNWFQTGKGVRQDCILSLYLFNLYAEYIMRTLGWTKHKLESRFPGEISITSDIQMTPPLWQKVKKN